ncbi:hypothetical protein VB151_03550 [Xanthomonas fragariae]|uniref:hypothetical protein n=1 Tax=Xanthomonas fragariae TaxID=48664 RepID=UPI0003271D76|nr:hypothetical protein [Xanthomonas fragariae]AOD14786.1 hypothetical protein BER92_08575 [Xanthomonas fragariae]AOD18180.1 hypothetical protein BER93_08600 [Xanthomonas fragariae]ENZ96396.1 hypothetical protein O1K_05141 [Xanthomonas fragariae LMG 25863]MBL9195807.1 hypothetical protein [Xanthomonas fragariae]MBL9220684.1 hypothetical protein [Xanthomonas fragariae]
MRAEPHATRPQLTDIVLLVPVSMFGVCIALGLMDVASRLFDLVYAGVSLPRWLSAAAEFWFGLMAFFGLVWAWIVVASSEASLRAHRRRTLIEALGLLDGIAVALYLLADWLLSGRIELGMFLVVVSGSLAVAPMLVAARRLPRSVRAVPPATMLRGYRYGQ